MKVSKASLRYTDEAHNRAERCKRCRHWLRHQTCEIVRGLISSRGWRNRFQPETASEYADGGGVDESTGAFHIPHDTITALGGGSHEMGLRVADAEFGHHTALGRGVIHPDVVAHIGGGDLRTGIRRLAEWSSQVRRGQSGGWSATSMHRSKFEPIGGFHHSMNPRVGPFGE